MVVQGHVLGCPWYDSTTLQSQAPCTTTAHPCSASCLVNQCWSFTLASSTVEPRVGCQQLQTGDSHCGACLPSPPGWGMSVRPTALRGQCPCAGQGLRSLSESVLRSQVLEIRFLIEKLVLCNQSPKRVTRKHQPRPEHFQQGPQRCSCPRKRKATF